VGLDLVGIYAAGPVYRGFANSLGQRNWHEVTSFNLQWSLYHRADKAVKTAYCGFDWSAAAFAAKMDDARERLALLGGARAVARARQLSARISRRRRWKKSPACFPGEASRAARWRLVRAACSGSRMARRHSTLRSDSPRTRSTAVAPAFQGEGFTRPRCGAAGARGPAGRFAGQSAHGQGICACHQRRQRGGDARIARHGGRRFERIRRAGPRSTADSTSAISGI
jgi:hypothetical protein